MDEKALFIKPIKNNYNYKFNLFLRKIKYKNERSLQLTLQIITNRLASVYNVYSSLLVPKIELGR